MNNFLVKLSTVIGSHLVYTYIIHPIMFELYLALVPIKDIWRTLLLTIRGGLQLSHMHADGGILNYWLTLSSAFMEANRHTVKYITPAPILSCIWHLI